MKVKLLSKTAAIPSKGTPDSAGWDLYADLDRENNTYSINPFSTEKISTGIAIEVPKGYFGAIFPRSGLSTKEGLRPANCVGVIDSDYRGPVIVALHNDTPIRRTITHNQRIAQLVLIPYSTENIEIVETLEETNRGDGGFGSTGV